MIQKLYKLTLLGVMTLGVAGANTIVTVNNFSFETTNTLTLVCGTGCAFNINAIPDWTNSFGSGGGGTFQPGPPSTLTYFNNVPEGTRTAYANTGGTFSQTVGVTAVAGQTYSLVVALGRRNDGFPFAALIELLFGNTVVATGTGVEPTQGNWADYTATYAAQAADAGQSITIRLRATADQGNFDNVRLSFAPTPGFTPPGGGGGNNEVPEPSAVMLTGLGLAGLVAVRQRLGR